MTARVARVMPPFPRVARHYIGKAYTASLAAAHVDFVAHMGGVQLSHCLEALFGNAESTSASFRFLVRAGANTRAVAVCVVPMGFTGSNPSITIAAAEGETVKTVRQDYGGVADLGDVMDPGHFKWTVPVTPGLNEIAVVTNNVRLHSACAYEVPRAELRGTEIHVDRSLADPAQYLTDDVAGSDVRGATELVNMPRRLRTNMRRHVFNLPCSPGLSSVGAGPDYLIGSAAAAHGPRILARDVQGGVTTTTPVSCKVRVDALGAGWSGDIVFVFPGGGNATINAVNATGWWPRAGGELVDPGAVGTMAFVDRLKVTATRAAGVGVVTCNSFFVVEEV